jgi:hypothetical protein
MRTIHETKMEVAEACWQALEQSGLHQSMIAMVSMGTIEFLPGIEDDPQGYQKLVAHLVEVAWKVGFADGLLAVENGTVKGVKTKSETDKHGNN